MKKCDICQTPIPLGEKRCPKCGYIFPNTSSAKMNQSSRDSMPHQVKMPQIQKRKNKRNHSGVLKFFVIIGSLAGTVIFSLTIIRKVTDKILHKNPYEVIEVVKDGTFKNFEDLNLANSSIAKEVLPYFKKVKSFQASDCIFDEYYEIKDNEIKNVKIGLSRTLGNKEIQLDAYNYSGNVWYLRGFQEFYDQQFSIEDFEIISEFCDVDLNMLYTQILALHQIAYVNMQIDHLEENSYGQQFGDYTVNVYIGSSVKIEVVKI